MKRAFPAALAVLVFLAAIPTAYARTSSGALDVVFLKTGGQIAGLITSETDDTLVVERASAVRGRFYTARLARKNVTRVERLRPEVRDSLLKSRREAEKQRAAAKKAARKAASVAKARAPREVAVLPGTVGANAAPAPVTQARPQAGIGTFGGTGGGNQAGGNNFGGQAGGVGGGGYTPGVGITHITQMSYYVGGGGYGEVEPVIGLSGRQQTGGGMGQQTTGRGGVF